MIEALSDQENFVVTATEDANVFMLPTLEQYRVVIFLNTSGDLLDDIQELGFQNFVRGGGGFVGIHAASDTEHDWPWYGELVGAFFSDHPAIQEATVEIEDPNHSSTRSLPNPWVRTDEWYNFASDPRSLVHVLLTVDEESYEGGTMGDGHPIAWCHEFDGGRSWYTAGGHTIEAYDEPFFRAHVLGGIQWAAGKVPGSCAVP